MMTKRPNRARAMLIAAMTTGAILAGAITTAPDAKAASEIAIVVNDQAITTGDVQRRAAFLRLQQRSGNLNEMAREELVDEAIKMREARRIGGVASDAQVDQAVERFASGNNLSMQQVTQIFNQAGIGLEHFRQFLRVQITWPRIVQARYAGSSGGDGMSQQELVSRMLERGDDKPSTTEYILQQVIFVVPEARRDAVLGQRRREAEQLRSRFSNCDSTREVAASLRDVSVRDLGRVMQPELPPEWKEQIESTSQGGTTGVRNTDRGVEFIAVCSAREVSDDLAAEMVFRQEDQQGEGQEENSERFLEELKARAAISYR